MNQTWGRVLDVASIPADLTTTPLRHYAQFKIGVGGAVDDYAALLENALASGVDRRPSSLNGWLFASPPVGGVPAAANLLAQATLQRLQKSLPGEHLSLIELRKQPLGELFLDEHYGGRDLEGRREYLRRTRSGWESNARLTGASVVFINDIYVTGAQQETQAMFFEAEGVLRVHWQYVFAISGCAFETAARLESQLNQLGLEDDRHFVELLFTEDFTVTTKCLWRLFGLDEHRYQQALISMPVHRRREILRMLESEKVPVSGAAGRRLGFLYECVDESGSFSEGSK